MRALILIIITVNVLCRASNDLAAVKDCLLDDDCWVKYSFQYDNTWTDCHGDQYVSHTHYLTGQYVGVVLCNETRYKILMSDSLYETFVNIGDDSGNGQDHCEFVTKSPYINVPTDFWNTPTMDGFKRSHFAEEPQQGVLGYPGVYSVKWYECGVSIPGTSTVVEYSGDGTDIGDLTNQVTQPPGGLSRIMFSYNDCDIRANSQDSRADVSPMTGGYKRYSCNPCMFVYRERNVLSVYQSSDRINNIIEVSVLPADSKYSLVELILTSYEAVHWKFNELPDEVYNIILISYHEKLSESPVDLPANHHAQVERINGYVGYGSYPNEMRGMFEKLQSFFSSFTGIYETRSITLKPFGIDQRCEQDMVNPMFTTDTYPNEWKSSTEDPWNWWRSSTNDPWNWWRSSTNDPWNWWGSSTNDPWNVWRSSTNGYMPPSPGHDDDDDDSISLPLMFGFIGVGIVLTLAVVGIVILARSKLRNKQTMQPYPPQTQQKNGMYTIPAPVDGINSKKPPQPAAPFANPPAYGNINHSTNSIPANDGSNNYEYPPPYYAN